MMKVLLLLALAASPAVYGRRMLLQDGCSDFSALSAETDVSDIVSLIKGFDLLPGGVPANVTIFLPNNDAIAALLAQVPIPGLTVESLPALAKSLESSLGVVGRLISALLLHIVPGGAWEPDALLAEGTLPTALGEVHPGYTLKFEEAGPGNYTITTTAGEVASIVGEPIMACGSAVYVIDQVLVPNPNLLAPDFPQTSLEEALAVLGGGEASSAPTPAP